MESVRLAIVFLAMLAYLTALGFNCTSVTTSNWYLDNTNTTAGVPVRRGLWIQCDFDGVCSDIAEDSVIHATRAFTLMAFIVGILLLVLLLWAINEEAPTYKLLAAAGLFVAAIFQLIGMGVYTDELRSIGGFQSSNWGYSFEFGWAACFLYAFAGVLFLVAGTLLHGQKRTLRYGHVRA